MKKPMIVLGIIFYSLICSSNAFAVLNNDGVLDSITTQFRTDAVGWGGQIFSAANYLFWVLVAISMVWTFGFMVLRKADISEFFAEFLKFTITIGFFKWILDNGTLIAGDIILSLRRVAATASGVPDAISPSGIVDVGFEICFKVIDKSSILKPVDSAVALCIGIIICVMLALIAVNMVVLMCSSYFLLYGGIFFLGFGGSKWTSDMAINYYKTVLKVAVQLFAMILLVGTGQRVLNSYHALMSKDMPIKQLVVMLIVSIVLFYLVNKIPELLASVVTGGMGSIPGGGGFGAGTAMGAMALGASAMATAGTSLAGGASAVKAAIAASGGGEGGGAAQAAASSITSGFTGGGGEGGEGGGGGGEGGGGGVSGAFSGGSNESQLLTTGGESSSNEPNSISDGSEANQEPESEEAPKTSGSTEDGGGVQDMGDDSFKDAGLAPEAEGAKQTPSNNKEDDSRNANTSSSTDSASAPAFAANVIKNLIQGTKDVAKDNMNDRISSTTGGKIAAAIKERAKKDTDPPDQD